MKITAPKRRSLDALGLNLQVLPERKIYLDELIYQYHYGLISIDRDDPRTTRGLSDAEVNYVLGEE